MTLAIQPPAGGIGVDPYGFASKAELITTQVIRNLAPHLGAAGSAAEGEALATLVPKVKPMVTDLLTKLDKAAAPVSSDSTAQAERVVASVLGSLVPALVPGAATAGAIAALLAELPTVVDAIRAHFKPEEVIDDQAGAIVRDSGGKANDDEQ